ncbi:hypothetical protein LCGC14_2600990 [marine sediment metagenome]|uniref:Tyr recombinase domain-containing protein n=1 Tax=marine sediment metagenome TaxID=412755 RepID=A0A0F9CJQ6_9ZZZZ
MPVEIYKRGRIWHYRGTAAGRRLRGTTGATEKAIAQRIAAEAERSEWRRHLDGPGAHVTFAQAAIEYRAAEKPTRFLSIIEDHWKDTPVREITPGAVIASARKLYPNAKGATRNRQVIVPTQAIINHAASLEWCSPIRIKRFKVDTRTKVPATAAWVRDFALHASPHLGAMCLFMFGTGARRGEATQLQWRDLDLTARTATIRQAKVQDTRIAHLPETVVIALANIPSNRNPDEPVFQYLGAGNVKQVWDAVIERAGIERLTPHSCRHGFATTMLRQGIDPKTVAKLGGWKDVATVMKYYAHAMDDPTLTEAVFDTELTQSTASIRSTARKQRRI